MALEPLCGPALAHANPGHSKLAAASGAGGEQHAALGGDEAQRARGTHRDPEDLTGVCMQTAGQVDRQDRLATLVDQFYGDACGSLERAVQSQTEQAVHPKTGFLGYRQGWGSCVDRNPQPSDHLKRAFRSASGSRGTERKEKRKHHSGASQVPGCDGYITAIVTRAAYQHYPMDTLSFRHFQCMSGHGGGRIFHEEAGGEANYGLQMRVERGGLSSRPGGAGFRKCQSRLTRFHRALTYLPA